jgi:glycerol kinase
VWFVPALLGLGTPVWDFGARGTFIGLTRGSGRPELVRAVLEGVAHRGADLVVAAESDSGLPVDSLRVDGGMSANPVFTQALADACGRTIEIAPVLEATTLGAAYLAGMAVGTWADEDDVAGAWAPRQVIDPQVGDDERAVRRTGGSRPAVGPRPPSPSSPPSTSEADAPGPAPLEAAPTTTPGTPSMALAH